MIGQVAELSADDLICAWHRLSLNGVTESNLFLDFLALGLIMMNIKLGARLTLTVLLI